MLSEILSSTSNNFNISREPSFDLGSAPRFDRPAGFSPRLFSERESPSLNAHSGADNNFMSNTTTNLLRNWSNDNPMGLFDEAALQNLDNNFDLFGSNEGQTGLDFELEPRCQQSNQTFLSSHTEVQQIDQNFGDVQPLFADIHSPSIHHEERYTGKNSPPEQEDHSELQKKTQKVKRKKIQKNSKTETDSMPKKPVAKTQKIALSARKIIPKRESKNIVKNYGKAMATFSLSIVAAPYLQNILLTRGVNMEAFKNFVINNKEKIDGIGTLRNLLFADATQDDPQLCKLKCAFRDICEVFARDFALNWIFSSRSQYKSALLEFRFKMLRRVRDPSSFTFLKPQ